jgi:glucose-6-phosphate 1-dehydrogenase
MQLLSLCLIDVTNFNFDNLQNLTTKVIDSFELGNDNIRGQYIGYKTEVNNPNSFVETAAAVEIKSNNSN